jgi:flagellin
MSLTITNNVASLTAQHNLGKTNQALSLSLERLSSGLKINRGADGPAALVISEEQRGQINGLQTALGNVSKAVSEVQTGEGALNEINSLLLKIRGLAVDSANTGVNDATSLAANQAEVSNALSTIDSIAKSTKFGTKYLLDGSATSVNFQIGANAGETISVNFGNAQSSAVGKVTGNTYSDLSKIDVSSSSANYSDIIKVVDQAISDISSLRGKLGAVQANSLESTANNLRTTLENTTAAESTIRDTDFAAETANFTKNQVLLQAGSSVLQNANQTSQLVLGLLRG